MSTLARVVPLMMLLSACASGAPRPEVVHDATRGTLVVTPDLATVGPAQSDGWAGVSYALWYVAAAFSADARRFVSCDPGAGECRVIDVASGEVIERRAPAGNLDDAPDGILFDAAIAALAEAEHLVARQGPWPSSAVVLEWSTTPAEDPALFGMVTWTLVDTARGARIELARFTSPAATDDVPGAITPLPPIVSPDGRMLALRALGQVGQSLRVDERLVPIGPAFAALAR